MSKFTFLKLAAATLLGAAAMPTFAKNTPIEAFIAREKKQHDFVPVNGMFRGEVSSVAADIEKQVANAQTFTVNPAMQGDIIERRTQAITLSIPKQDGGSYELDLARFDFLSDGFKVRAVANKVPTVVNYVPGVYYRGVVKNAPHSIASFSFFNDEIFGVFAIDGIGNIVIVPNTLTPAKGDYVMYNEADMKSVPRGGCRTNDLPRLPQTKNTAAKNSNVLNSCKDVEQYLVADFATYTLNGGANNGITKTANYFTAVYNMVAALYRNEHIYTSIKLIDVHTTADVYGTLANDSRDHLEEFGAEIGANMNGADLAALWTVKPGNMGGIAWLGVLCSSFNPQPWGNHGPYSFSNLQGNFSGTTLPTYSWDIEVFTHEMGHNLGSPHTHDCAWGPNNDNAIDWCAPTANPAYATGSCQVPNPTPTVKGTIMSYCHLTNIGISFVNGFGQEPGDLIRDAVFSSSCAEAYIPQSPVSVAGKTLMSTRECTDDNGVTFYWNDNNNAVESDDQLALTIIKGSNDIGNLDDVTFSANVYTTAKYGTDTGNIVIMPVTSSDVLANNVAANRYWSITPITQPTTPVEVMVPFTSADMSDIDGSVPGNALTASDFMVYTTANGISANTLQNATIADVKIYKAGTSASVTTWGNSKVVDTNYVSFKTVNLGGGSMFYSYNDPVSVNDISASKAGIKIYPNPTSTNWSVLTAQAGTLRLFSVDGRLVVEQVLNAGVNTVNANTLPAGLYMYRINGETGTLTKQ